MSERDLGNWQDVVCGWRNLGGFCPSLGEFGTKISAL
jgi:hypothetical protein